MLGLIKCAAKSVGLVGLDVISNTKVELKTTDVHIAGVSCVPFSTMGLRDGEDGEARAFFMCIARLIHFVCVRACYLAVPSLGRSACAAHTLSILTWRCVSHSHTH